VLHAQHGSQEPEVASSTSQHHYLGNHYRIVRTLGSGGMGTVYQAYDEQLERDVAIKVLDAGAIHPERARTLLRTEARAMARVQHPNVVAIHAYDVHDGHPYFVMEYVPGQSLAQWLEVSPRLELDEVSRILDELCLGVQAIHAAGTVHRDVKPSNVLIASSGRVAVSDLGLAGLEPYRDGQTIAGTPAYIAPEIARGEVIDPARAHLIDIYSLGVLAFELLTGQRPFQARAVPGLLAQHAFMPPPVPSTVAAGIPSEFDAVILRALAKEPEDRYQAADEFRRDLQRARNATPSQDDRPFRLLVADDDEATRDALYELIILEFPQVRLKVVADATAAVRSALELRPDVIITDLHMPHGGAFEVVSALRQHQHTAATPIVVLTAYGGGGEWQRLRKLGVDRFLVKPVDFDSLAAVIRSIVRGSTGPQIG